jgi:hypothetical protein
MIRKSGVDEAGGLLAEHLLLKMTMEEGVADIHLVDGPMARDDELRIVRMVLGFTTGAKVSAKSMPARCRKPRTTQRAL